MGGNLITLATYTYRSESFVLVAKLESEGIECFLANDNILAAHPFLSAAVGGVQVQVREEDLEKARAVLMEVESQSRAGEELLKDHFKDEGLCPNCESMAVYRKKGGFPSSQKNYVCAECGHAWTE